MKQVYLADGQCVRLHAEVGGQFLVSPIYIYESDGGDIETESENIISVKQIFDKPPREVYDKQVKDLVDKAAALNVEVMDLVKKKNEEKNELEKISKTVIDIDKFMINKNDLLKAKNIVLFPEGRIMPLMMTSKDNHYRGIKISFSFSLIGVEGERAWGYQLNYDYSDGYGHNLCKKYGILIDPSSEEIESTIRKRLKEFEFSESEISSVHEMYLSPDQVNIKNNFLRKNAAVQRANLEKQLEAIKSQIDKLPTIS